MPTWLLTRAALLVTVAVMIHAPPGFAATPEEVNGAVDRATAYLWSIQKNGNWESVIKPDLSLGSEGNATGSQFTGQTALVTYGLLCSGVQSSDPRLKLAIKLLKDTEPHGVYAAGFRCLLWGTILLTRELRIAAHRDFDYLLDALHHSGPGKGEFGYRKERGIRGNPVYDQSVSQIAVLGLWTLSRQGFEVPTSDWQLMDSAWRSHQFTDGSWPYYDSPVNEWGVHSPSMTAAGVASLFIFDQVLKASADCNGNPRDLNIDNGFNWLSGNFETVFQPIRAGLHVEPYTLFAVSRIGAASGYRSIGQIDWFARASDYLCKSQSPAGSWSTNYLPEVSGTALGLLCLEYGRAPIVVNKLQYKIDDGQSPASDAHWNQRPSDCFNFVGWLGKSLEARFNWQIVSLDLPPDQLQSAPILLITGDQKLVFTDLQKAALRQFAQSGGLILGTADCGSDAFKAGFTALAGELFPQYPLRELPADHPIYANEQYPASRWKTHSPLQGVSNGVRELMLLASADLSAAFARQNDLSEAEKFELAANITLYATDKNPNRRYGETYLVKDDQSVPVTKEIAVHRLQYEGNWDPEPEGWRRLAAIMHNQYQVQLRIDTVHLGDGSLKAPGLAHVTGTGKCDLNEAQRKELSSFVAGGGTLLVDAAGGSSEFAGSVDAMLKTIFPEAGPDAFSTPLDLANDLFKGEGHEIKSVEYRPFARSHVTGRTTSPMLYAIKRDGRNIVYFSRMDLGAGLVGESVDGVIGYSPASSVALVRNILLSCSQQDKAQ